MKSAPRFKVGDRVKVVKLLDTRTDHKLIGMVGTIEMVDDIVLQGEDGRSHRLEVNYDVRPDRAHPTLIEASSIGVHYMHEEELVPA